MAIVSVDLAVSFLPFPSVKHKLDAQGFLIMVRVSLDYVFAFFYLKTTYNWFNIVPLSNESFESGTILNQY